MFYLDTILYCKICPDQGLRSSMNMYLRTRSSRGDFCFCVLFLHHSFWSTHSMGPTYFVCSQLKKKFRKEKQVFPKSIANRSMEVDPC